MTRLSAHAWATILPAIAVTLLAAWSGGAMIAACRLRQHRLPPVPSRLRLIGWPALLVGAALLASTRLSPSRGVWAVGAFGCAAAAYALHGLLRRLIEVHGGLTGAPSWLLHLYALLGSPLFHAAGYEAALAWPLSEPIRRGLGSGLQALPALALATGWCLTGARGALVLGGAAWLANLAVAAQAEEAGCRLRAALAWLLLLVGAGALYAGVLRGIHLIMLHPVPTWADGWTYVTASRVYYEHHLDPYWNANIQTLFASGDLALPDQANSALQEYGFRMNYWLDDLGGRGSIGYAGTPWMIPLHFTLYRWLGFRTMAIALTLSSLLALSAAALLFARRLRPRRWVTIPATLGALWLFAPTILSLHLGQLEGLYVPLLALALYRLAFHPTTPDGRVHRVTPIVSGLSIALASAIKIYPAILGAYLTVMALAQTARRRQANGWVRAFTETLEGQTLGWFLIGGTALVIAAWFLVGGPIIASFLERLRLLVHLGAANLHEYRPSFADYGMHLLDAMAPTLPPATRAAAVRGALTALQIGLAWCGWRLAQRLTNASATADSRRHLLGASWLLMGLPLALEHWWSYYNVIQFIPLMIVLAHARSVSNARTRQTIYGLLGVGLTLANPETIRWGLWLAGVTPSNLLFLITTPGPAHLFPPGWTAWLFGFPGQALLFAAAWRTATATAR